MDLDDGLDRRCHVSGECALTNASDDDDGGWVEGCVFEFKALETTMTLRYVSTAMKARDKDSRLMQT